MVRLTKMRQSGSPHGEVTPGLAATKTNSETNFILSDGRKIIIEAQRCQRNSPRRFQPIASGTNDLADAAAHEVHSRVALIRLLRAGQNPAERASARRAATELRFSVDLTNAPLPFQLSVESGCGLRTRFNSLLIA